jgi:hypothetical protein
MKKGIIFIAILAMATVLFLGCAGANGANGKTYLKFTFSNDEATGFFAKDFPSPVPYDGTAANKFWATSSIDTTTGDFLLAIDSSATVSGTGKWVLFDAYGPSSVVPYIHVYFNDSKNYPIIGYLYNTNSGVTASDILSYYISQGYFSQYANNYRYTITANQGEAGKIFGVEGADGADKFFTIVFNWNPGLISIYSRNTSADQVRVIEDSEKRVVKELTDGDVTFRLSVAKKPGSIQAAPEKTGPKSYRP